MWAARYFGATQLTGDGSIPVYRVPNRLKMPRTAPGAAVAAGPGDGRRRTRGLPAVSFYFALRNMEITFMTFNGRPFAGWLRTGDPTGDLLVLTSQRDLHLASRRECLHGIARKATSIWARLPTTVHAAGRAVKLNLVTRAAIHSGDRHLSRAINQHPLAPRVGFEEIAVGQHGTEFLDRALVRVHDVERARLGFP
jgi:hypothetical protein